MGANDRTHVPLRFRKAVSLHIIKNLLAEPLAWRVPLLLGIHGPSGEGKTFQCERVLTELGVQSFLISGGELESPDAGRPAMLIRKTYIDASQYMNSTTGSASVVLINDFDTAVGNWGDLVQTTVNRQHVFGEMMHLVDYPTRVQGVTTRRVPIILTGNDFTKLYYPLVRAGRMTSFEWLPTAEEKVTVLQPMLGLAADEILRLTNELEEFAGHKGTSSALSTAFFAHLISTVFDDQLARMMEMVGAREMIRNIRTGQTLQLSSAASYDRLLLTGRRIIESGIFVNHLKRGL